MRVEYVPGHPLYSGEKDSNSQKESPNTTTNKTSPNATVPNPPESDSRTPLKSGSSSPKSSTKVTSPEISLQTRKAEIAVDIDNTVDQRIADNEFSTPNNDVITPNNDFSTPNNDVITPNNDVLTPATCPTDVRTGKKSSENMMSCEPKYKTDGDCDDVFLGKFRS